MSEPLVPRLETLLELWRQRYGTRPIPARPLLKPADLVAWAEHTAWLVLGAGGRFKVERFGLGLIRRFGHESTGDWVDDLAPDIAEGLNAKLERADLTRTPVAGSALVQFGREAAIFSDLVLPLAGDAARINELIVASYEVKGKRPDVP